MNWSNRFTLGGFTVTYCTFQNSAIGWVTPLDKLRGRELEIFEQRDKKLETAREKRKVARRLERFQAA